MAVKLILFECIIAKKTITIKYFHKINFIHHVTENINHFTAI